MFQPIIGSWKYHFLRLFPLCLGAHMDVSDALAEVIYRQQ